jgi:hypothetical protein
MSGRRLASLVLAAALACPFHAGAVSFSLPEGAREAARTAGRDSVTREDFDSEWRVDNGAGERVTVLTPFHRLAQAARNAAFRQEALRPSDENKILQAAQDRLTFLVELRGDHEAFAIHSRPRLVVGSREVEPAFVQNERMGAPRPGGGFTGRSVYAFPTTGLQGTAVVTLVVRDAGGRVVSRFTVDLSKMR